jgi:signal peptidase II
MQFRFWHWAFLLSVVLVVIGIDQFTKALVVAQLAIGESYVPVPALSDFFLITRSYNTGSAFGMFAGVPGIGNVFVVIAAVVTVFLVWSYRTLTSQQPFAKLATGLVIGGALGNVLDRLEYGHVVDFIHYRIPNVIANVSNLADHAIVFGVLLMIWLTWQTPVDDSLAGQGDIDDGSVSGVALDVDSAPVHLNETADDN